MTKKLLSVLFASSIAVVMLFVLIANFSEQVTQYSCKGTYKTKNQTEETGEVFLKVSKYRWWVSLWNDQSDGTVLVEFRKGFDPTTKLPVSYIDHLLDIRYSQETIQLRDLKSSPAGVFYLLSNSVTLSSTYGWFDGKCSETK
jgi:hypothetical protein